MREQAEEQEKIRALAALVLQQTRARLARLYGQQQADAETVEVIRGKAYTRIDRGQPGGGMAGYLMIEHGTGAVYGIKGYGVPDKKRRYGTLDTISRYVWGDYHPEAV